MTKIKIEYWPLSQLDEYDKNPRRNDQAVDQMCVAIKEMGFKVPIIAKSNGLIVDGHLRYKAARQLNLAEVPVVLADDLTETQIRAFRIMINQSAHWADWDEELLAVELKQLDAEDFDLDILGFSDEDLDGFLLEEPEGNTEDDAVPEVQEQPVSKTGDVWILGSHRLLCGSATESDDVNRLMDGQLADMVFTDPPYNVDYANPEKDGKATKDRRIKNDNLGADFYAFLLAAMTNMLTVSKGAIYVCMSSSELDTLQRAFRDAGGKWSTFLIWAKNTFTLGNYQTLASDGAGLYRYWLPLGD